jgi:hypothetical protein
MPRPPSALQLRHMKLTFPNRVSRVYPLACLLLLLCCSALFYSWQTAEIGLSSYQEYPQRQIALYQTIDQLLEKRKADQAALAKQATQLKETGDRLLSLESSIHEKEIELAQANTQLAKQKQQLSASAKELQTLRSRPPLFSFQNQSSRSDISEKQEAVKHLVTLSYDEIQSLYGTPYLLHSITITFVDSFQIAGAAGEIHIENSAQGISIDIRIKDFNPLSFQDTNTIIHEIIHAFHGIAVYEDAAIEEGMTVAATDAVMQSLIAKGAIPAFSPLYITLSAAQFTQYNANLTVYANTSDFYHYNQVGKVYQMLGYAWRELYREQPNIFKAVNSYAYAKIQLGEPASSALARQAIAANLATVNGKPIADFLTQPSFNPR